MVSRCAAPRALAAVVVVVLALVAGGASALMFNLPANGRRCLRDEMHANQMVVGEFEVNEAPNQFVNYQVVDSKGHILAQKKKVSKGKFSFTSEHVETFELCFESEVPPNVRGVVQEVQLKTLKGVETKNYEGLGEAAKLKPLEIDLTRLEDLSESIVQDFVHMRKQEEAMRDTNESTNNRVLFFSIFSMCCLLGLATWQVLYLRRFFKAKKLIE